MTKTAPYGWLMVMATVIAWAIPSQTQAEGPLEIEIKKMTSIRLNAHGAATLQRTSDGPIEETVLGGEGGCDIDKEGRKSQASANVRSEALSKDEETISINLMADTYSRGGHFRTCGACVNGICLGIIPSDTSAAAIGTASARVFIKYRPDYPRIDYQLLIRAASDGNVPTIEVFGTDGKKLATPQNFDKPVFLPSKPGAAYHVDLLLRSSSKDKGLCCEDHKVSNARVDISLMRAPRLEANKKLKPFIRGGKETTSYRNVGALLINGELHCTGSVIGAHTILTAAHCLYGYKSRLEKFTFLLGSNLTQPDSGPFAVTDFMYPDGQASGFSFNEKTLEDDIGLVFVRDDLTVSPVRIYDGGNPTWEQVLSNKVNLLFVGFGYDIIENQPIGAGIKREAGWRINRIENRRIAFQGQRSNTCKGDSGGPAFLVINQLLFQAAITSGGDDSCTEGVNTRIDAYRNWLDGKIR